MGKWMPAKAWLKLPIGSAFFPPTAPANHTKMKVARPKILWHELVRPCYWAPATKLIDLFWTSCSELLGSNPVLTLLTFGFVEGSALGAKMFWRVLAKNPQTIRCWLVSGVKFGSGCGSQRFPERPQTGLAGSSCWRNRIILTLPVWVF